MKNLTEYNDFKNKKRGVESSQVNEGAQLFDNVWKVRTRVEIPTSLINAYVKKVQQDTGEDPRKKWSEQELAEEITKYVTTAYLTIENLPISIVTNIDTEPTVQTQEEMPEETQVQPQAQPQAEPQPQAQPQPQAEPQAEEVAQAIPQAPVQGQEQVQAPVQGQAPAQEI